MVDTETLRIDTQGRSTAVYDLAGGSEYHYTKRPVKRSQGRTEATVSVDTDTLKVELLPGCGLRITDRTAGKIYTLQRRGAADNGKADR